MHIIDLDATGWKTPDDFYNALLPELGAPEWHGHNPNALNDSVIWGDQCGQPADHDQGSPPTRGTRSGADEVRWAKRGIDLGREDFRAQNGRDIDAQLQIMP